MSPWFSLPDFSLTFTSILLQSLPFLLLGSVLSACLDQFVPDVWLGRLLRKSSIRGIFFGCVAGFFLPVCECGAIPVVRRLILKGVPVSAACSYFFSSSILNPLCITSTWLAFRTRNPGAPLWMCGWRVVGGILLVLILSWLMRCWKSGSALQPEFANEVLGRPSTVGGQLVAVPVTPKLERLHRFVQTVTQDFLSVAMYVIVGATLAAFFNTSVNRAWLQQWIGNPLLAPLLTICLAQILSLCSTTDAFIIAAFPQMPAHAALAFLVAGPLCNFKLLWLYRTVFRWRVVVTIGFAAAAGSYLFSILLFYLKL